jgi:hypothetical protein
MSDIPPNELIGLVSHPGHRHGIPGHEIPLELPTSMQKLGGRCSKDSHDPNRPQIRSIPQRWCPNEPASGSAILEFYTGVRRRRTISKEIIGV